jgi:hypothetical protein
VGILENKSFYYLSSWDDAAVYSRVLEAMGIPHAVEAPGGPLPIQEGQLAIVFPDLNVRQYNSVRELFGGNGIRYVNP